MKWNHRVLRLKDADGPGYDLLTICEAYFEEETPEVVKMHGSERAPFGESIEDLRWVLTKMLEALDKPIIEDDI
jgi:hypothetical protein